MSEIGRKNFRVTLCLARYQREIRAVPPSYSSLARLAVFGPLSSAPMYLSLPVWLAC